MPFILIIFFQNVTNSLHYGIIMALIMKGVYYMKKMKVVSIALLVMFGLLGCGSSTTQDEADVAITEQTKNESTEIKNLETTESFAKEEKGTQSSENENLLDSKYLSDMPDTEEKILEKVEIITEKTIKGDIVVFVTNNNDYSIPDIELQALFYKDGNIIDTDKDGHDAVIPKNTVVSKMDAPSEYDDYEIKASVDWDYGTDYRNWLNNLDVNHNIGNDNVIVQFENLGKVDIEELEYIVVYYLDGQIADTSFAEDIYDVMAGDTVVEEVSSYGVEFDEYEVYINQAHTFSDEAMNGELIKDTFPENIGRYANWLEQGENGVNR